ncbi:MAG: phytanoyl-CoA dioxygenase family protein [Caldilineaceae bacterium]|nr:phytanoyl-CoA dioxygenase family protein [Caldilineaceae bacterium]
MSNKPTELEIFLFDLRGYIVLKNALSAAEVADLNAGLDAIPPLKKGEWYGYVHGHSFGPKDGLNYQQIYEAGAPFEKLIDHPAWIEKVKHFVGGEGTFDYNHGPLFIDENFANFRDPGEAIGIHSGGHTHTKRTQFHHVNGKFHCGQINILMALSNMGPGDGTTMVIPGSHKSNYGHPHLAGHTIGEGGSVDGIEGAVEVHMEPGDALLFVDALCHGSGRRTNPGVRRTIVYRYGPSWGNFRHGYQASPELVARLTPERRQIVQPQRLLPREPQVAAS